MKAPRIEPFDTIPYMLIWGSITTIAVCLYSVYLFFFQREGGET